MKLGTLDAMGSDPTSTTSPPEAAAADLRRRCDPASLGFETTAEVEPSDAPAGQEPAEQALRLAAELDGGFNAVVTGPPGTGRRAAVLAWLSERARREPAPPDLVYVPNFTDAMRPRALDVPAGTGDRLAEDVATLVLVGHNPSISEVAGLLDDERGETAARDELNRGFPPGGVAVFTVEDDWSTLGEDGGTLASMAVPRG